MQSAFENDPLAMVAIAFGRLYPDKKYHAQIAGPAHKNDDGDTEYGSTVFAEDGSGEAWVDVCCDIPIIHAIEILAHELAHGGWPRCRTRPSMEGRV